MKIKGILLISLMLCIIFAVSSVAASDVNQTVMQEDSDDICQAEEIEWDSDDSLQSVDDEVFNAESPDSLQTTDEDALSIDSDNESNPVLSATYADVYLDNIKTRYNSGDYYYLGWTGYFDGYFEVYKGGSLYYDEYISGTDEDLQWSLEDISPGTYSTKLITSNGLTLGKGKFVIKKSSSKISVKSFKATAGSKFYCYAYVKDKYTGRNYNGGTVKFKINGKTYKAKLKSGVAVAKIKIPSKVKKYTCKATFSGGSNVYKSTTKFKITVKKKPHYKVFKFPAKDKWITKKSGKYKVKVRVWTITSGVLGKYYDVDIIFYKNGKQQASSKYLTTYKYKVNGKWKWVPWRHGYVDHAYHRYTTTYHVGQIKVKFLPQ